MDKFASSAWSSSTEAVNRADSVVQAPKKIFDAISDF